MKNKYQLVNICNNTRSKKHSGGGDIMHYSPPHTHSLVVTHKASSFLIKASKYLDSEVA